MRRVIRGFNRFHEKEEWSCNVDIISVICARSKHTAYVFRANNVLLHVYNFDKYFEAAGSELFTALIGCVVCSDYTMFCSRNIFINLCG